MWECVFRDLLQSGCPPHQFTVQTGSPPLTKNQLPNNTKGKASMMSFHKIRWLVLREWMSSFRVMIWRMSLIGLKGCKWLLKFGNWMKRNYSRLQNSIWKERLDIGTIGLILLHMTRQHYNHCFAKNMAFMMRMSWNWKWMQCIKSLGKGSSCTRKNCLSNVAF
jgi:hypothetical protein